MIPFAGGSYLTYTVMDNSVAMTATPLGDHLTSVYMFVSGCLAAAVAKVTRFLHYRKSKIFLKIKNLEMNSC